MKFLRTFLAAAMIVATNPVDARIVTVTYTGILGGAVDETGVFGAPNTILTGLPYQTVYRFDTETPGATTTVTADGATLFGAGAASPSLGAILTINGRSVAVAGQTFGRRSGLNNGITSGAIDIANDAYMIGPVSYQRRLSDTVTATNALLPGAIDTPFSYTLTGGDTPSGGFDFRAQNIFNFQLFESARGSFIARSVTLSVEGVANPGVPEPASWVMFVTGFGLLGAAVRRKTAAAAH